MERKCVNKKQGRVLEGKRTILVDDRLGGEAVGLVVPKRRHVYFVL